MYKDLKVTSGEVAANNVKSAPDRLQGTATENKNIFDKLVELFVGKYNALLDELDTNEMSAVPPITINGYTISHANSGVTQGMYGTDQEQDPQHGEKFIIPYFITDEHGHIVSAGNSEVQLPSGGGGGGTDNYNDLSNKPSINQVTLQGNKTASDLGLAPTSHSHTKSEITDFPSLATVATTGDYDDLSDKPSIPTKTSDLTNDSGFITGYTETDPVFSASAAHGITNSDISGWNNKSDFSGDYDDLTNKPTIPSKTSDLTNDSGFSSVSFTRYTTSGTNIADIEIDGTTTKIYAPTSGGATSYDDLSNRPQINSTTLTGNKTLSDLGMKSEILDIFYPVGSYYETSVPATDFNPNTAWGGTWVLETSGQVHVSAGTGYTIGDTGGTNQIVYTPSGSTENVTLNDSQIAHGHTYTNPTVKTPTLTASNENYITAATTVTSINRNLNSAGTSGGDYNYVRVAHTGASMNRSAPSIASGKTCTVSGGGVANLSGDSSTRTSHTHTFTGTQVQLDNMQPYIVVNRWHRTV